MVQRINTYCLNFSKDLTHDSFHRTIAPLCIPTFWVDDALCSDIIASLLNYRLSKFQPLMPS